MPKYTLNINAKNHEVQVAQGTSLLWLLREHLGLTGTKYGCGIAQCGACTIHIDNKPMRACILKVENYSDRQEIKTIEGLSDTGNHPVQKAWVDVQVPQCGYCQSGQIMQAVSLLEENPNPSPEEIKKYMNGIICRCGTYLRVIEAIELASETKSQVN
jgi:isoquinoline 1-oxidoreductase alpha subunit